MWETFSCKVDNMQSNFENMVVMLNWPNAAGHVTFGHMIKTKTAQKHFNFNSYRHKVVVVVCLYVLFSVFCLYFCINKLNLRVTYSKNVLPSFLL